MNKTIFRQLIGQLSEETRQAFRREGETGETGNGAILTPGKIDGAGETVGEGSIGGTIF